MLKSSTILTGGKMKNLRAFTLAEVLITLGIIGVVAAMTIPTIVANQREKTTIARLKKAISIMSNAYIAAINEEGLPTDWGADFTPEGSKRLAEKIIPHLKIIENCGNTSNSSVGQKCWKNAKLKYLDKREFSGNDWNVTNASKFYKFVLENGMSIAIIAQSADCTKNASISPRCGYFLVDVDGPSKGENRMGYDVFMLDFAPDGVRNVDLSHPGFSRADQVEGWRMASWVITKGNMKYLDCPTTFNATTYECN
jgi:prepilin-type N-terminal cleavage/methylation domain-containing protein